MKNYRLLILSALVALALTSCRGYEVGDYYSRDDVSGLVLKVDDEGAPLMLLSMDEVADLDADSALLWGSTYDGGGWRLPNKEEMAYINKYRSLVNATLARRQEPQMMGPNTYYWTATPCSETHVFACGPLGLKCFFRTNHSPLYRARAVRYLDLEHHNSDNKLEQ